MSADPKQAEVFEQIQEAFRLAQARLSELKAAVAQHGELARVKAETDMLHHVRDKALRELGEAVWKQVQRGQLQLPGPLGPALQAVQEAERKLEVQAREINDLLMEGEAAAERLKKKK